MATEREELERLRAQVISDPRAELEQLRAKAAMLAQPAVEAAQPIQEAPVTAEEQIAQETGPLEAGVVSMGRGFMDIARGAQRLFVSPKESERIQAEARKEQRILDPLEEKHPVSTTIGRAVGQAAPFVPAGVAVGAIPALSARVAAATGLGATEGAAIALGQGADIEKTIESAGVGGAVAGGIEALLPVVGRLGGAIVRKVTGKAATSPILDSAGNPSGEFVAALKESGLTMEDLGEEAQRILSQTPERVVPGEAARKAIFEAEGLTPTKAQVTRNAADFQAQQEAAKTSGRVREALEAQDAILTTRFNQAVLETGGMVDAPTSTVTDALVDKASTLDQEISDLYNAARSAAPGAKNVSFEQLVSNLRKSAGKNEASGGAVKAIWGDLKSRGILDNKGNLVGKIDVETAEEVRKLMNQLYDPQNGFRNMLLRDLKDSLDDDVFSSAGKDVFKKGRQAKAAFEKELSRAKISKFDSRKANIVRDVLENKISPDTFADDVVFSKKWRANDIKQLKDYISTNEAGKSAFNDLRADILDKIKNNAFIGPEDAAGNRALSRAALERQLNKIGPGKMNVLFNKEERDFLKRMMNVTKLREPVRGTALGRGPSAQAIARLEKKLADLPIVGNLVEFIDVDVQGRTALRAKPTITPRQIGPIERELRGVAGPAGVAGVSALTAQEQQ
jgi:hypothetical protein